MRGYWGEASQGLPRTSHQLLQIKIMSSVQKARAARVITVAVVAMVGRQCKTKRDTGQNPTEQLMKSAP